MASEPPIREQDLLDGLATAHRGALDLAWIQAEWATVAAPDDPRMRRLVELMASRG